MIFFNSELVRSQNQINTGHAMTLKSCMQKLSQGCLFNFQFVLMFYVFYTYVFSLYNIAFNVNISFLNAKDYIIFMTCEENCNIYLEFCISMSQDNYLSVVMKTTHRDHIKTVCVKNRYLFKFFKSGKKLLISLKKSMLFL